MKIGILQTGLAPDTLVEKTGEYPGMFARLLDGHGFTFDSFAVLHDEFPESALSADGWLITGSRHGVYEDHGWIPPLESLIRDIFKAGRPLIGVCFGHQIIAQAMGGKVEKFEGGWSVGPTSYQFPEGPRVLQAWHQDQVITPPKGAETLASGPICKHAALLYPGHAYSIQPHPEYGDDFIKGLIDTRGPGLVPDPLLQSADQALGIPLDNANLAFQFAQFFKTGQIT